MCITLLEEKKILVLLNMIAINYLYIAINYLYIAINRKL